MRKVELTLDYQNYIESPPVRPDMLYSQACASDSVTVSSWKDVWLGQIKKNRQKYGPFKDKSIGKLFAKYVHQPIIVAGAGPSLKYNGHELKDRKDICLVSCLHNFHFMEDHGAHPDFYVSLDAGPVTIEEVSEGGSKSAEEYWAITKDRTLLAYIGTHPDLLAKWQGEIYFFNCPVPDPSFMEELNKIEVFHTWVSSGGNVLGACLYIAKGILGASMVAFVGADFSFSYDKKFHAWDSKYDKSLGYVIKAVDVFGNKVLSWQSYANFAAWFNWVSLQVLGIYINCTEGGIFGAYAEGNLMSVKQMSLKDFIRMVNLHLEIKEQCLNPEVPELKILF